MRNLRLPGALIGLGFVGVLAWAVAFAIAERPASESWALNNSAGRSLRAVKLLTLRPGFSMEFVLLQGRV